MSLRLLKIWSPNCGRLSTRILSKNEIVFGSDSKCDVVVNSPQDFVARLDFNKSELHFLELDERKRLAQGQVFQVGDSAFYWSEFKMPQTRFLKKLLMPLFALCFLLVAALWLGSESKPEVDCDQVGSQTHAYLSLKQSLHSDELTVAQARFNELLSGPALHTKCSNQQVLSNLEVNLLERKALHFIKTHDLIGAVESYKKMAKLSQAHELKALEERILSLARALAWESWKLETTSPQKAYELKKQVQIACQQLRPGGGCLDEG